MTEESVQSLLNLVEDELDSRRNKFSPSIYMAPGILRDSSPSSFNPKLVAIGPLHREDEDVQAFEAQKVSCLTNLLGRIDLPKEEILKSCMKEVQKSMEQIKACYVWTKTYNESEIAEMMVMDSCFILEFIYWYTRSTDESYPGNTLLAPTIVFDLVLLENQIPFFILDQIYKCTILKKESDKPLAQFIHPIFSNFLLFETDIQITKIPTNTETPHILSLLHEYYKPPSCFNPVSASSLVIRSAGDLDRVGVIFKSNQNPKWDMQMEVTFNRLPCGFGSWGKPTLRIPKLYLHDFTEVILRNLIAYEQSYQTGYYVTSYACAMDMLVNTQEDVTKLVESGVLKNDLGSNEEAASTITTYAKTLHV